ncbi:acyl transferase domain-containing protein [Aspergillus ambiguus]|uniref:acyl transferase domain-containing protein n=1 Tax=Aspergillus ambiguus TaxID=176160 RepID=UPI003CCCB0D0
MNGEIQENWYVPLDGALPTTVDGYVHQDEDNHTTTNNSSDIRLALAIPSDYFSVLDPLKIDFLLSISFTSKPPVIANSIEMALAFMEFLLSKEIASSSVISAILQSFDAHFLLGKADIHSLLVELTPSRRDRQRWLSIYFQVVGASQDSYPGHRDCLRGRVPSAFLNHIQRKQFKMIAVFGGQGDGSLTCMEELSDLYSTYEYMLRPLVLGLGLLLSELSQLPEAREFYQGSQFNLESWLKSPASIPGSQFISHAPVSMPLIGILSLARYSVVCQVLKLVPGELRDLLEAATGHSQGLLISIVISISDCWESFYENSRTAIRTLFWIGLECHQRAPRSCMPPDHSRKHPQAGDLNGPSYMLSVRGIERKMLDSILRRINESLQANSQLYIALVNSRDQFVIAGPTGSLIHLGNYIGCIKGPDNQSRVPFNQRKPAIYHTFLPISAPFHTPYLVRAAVEVKKQSANLRISPQQLVIDVWHTCTGQNLRNMNPDVNILDIAIEAITSQVCNWPVTLANVTYGRERTYDLSHILAFDRGGLGTLIKKITEGLGIRIIQCADLDSADREIGTMRDLFSIRLLDTSSLLQTWMHRYQPKLATGPGGGLETRLSRLLGTPPIMVSGMTPTTAHWDFVATVMNAGYHVELAGGGYHTSSDMENAINRLAKVMPPGRGITCNLIYANPRTLRWQITLLRKLSKSIPIDGLTIGAGVPSLDVVSDYIRSLSLRHISFKPGSIVDIRQVIAIAKAHPEFPVILQWTGGRGGGHHSFEDFHSPILSTYGAIREQSNIYLVAGSGFGDAHSIYPYLTGSWSANKSQAMMPFDGVLLGSRMMVAREAHTSPAVKQRIIKTDGLPDDEWEKTYFGPSGGIISVLSEMGEPIHKIATKAVLFWAEMDKTVFSLPHKDRLAYLTAHRDEIISRLNREFAKPWFGKNKNGAVVDLEHMTYIEVLIRMVELMYVKHQRRWIDPSYIDFTLEFATRALERLQRNRNQTPSLSKKVLKEDPDRFLETFTRVCPAGGNVLNPEDISFFLIQTKKPGQKPVNFIPVLNDDFEFYFKKDSLWQSEDLDAIIDQDVERVCILHGPVSARYSRSAESTAKDILDTILHSLVDLIQQDLPSMEQASPRESGYLEPELGLCTPGLITPDSWSSVSATGKEIFTEISLPSSATLSDSYDDRGSSAAVVGLGNCRIAPAWVRAVLGDKAIIQNRVRQNNPFRQFIEACPEATVQFSLDRSEISILHQGPHDSASSLKITSHNGVDILVHLHTQKTPVALQMSYRFDPNSSPFGLCENMENRNKHIKSFYSQLWFGEDLSTQMTVHDKFYGRENTLTAELLDNFIKVIGSPFSDHRVMFANAIEFPISIGIVIAWEVVSRPLITESIDGDLLKLVHLSNSFKYCKGALPLRVGDKVTSQSHIQSVTVSEAGKKVTVEAHILREGRPVMVVVSSFLFRGSFKQSTPAFSHISESAWKIELSSELDESILLHRSWFQLNQGVSSLVGQSLVFNLETHITYKKGGCISLHVSGNASCQMHGGGLKEVGSVNFRSNNCKGNPVLDFLKRRGSLGERRTDFKVAGWSGVSSIAVQMPANFNPIHLSAIFSSIAELPGTLSHGMLTSAIAAAALEHLVFPEDRERLRVFEASFMGMLRHTGMIDGRMTFTITVTREGNGETVLTAQAEIEQPATAYLFTGQGSQRKGMGMDLYNSSSVAKAIWDDIDRHLYETYGWSVLEIVQNNPKSHTVHFGGKRGRKIKQNYLSVTTDTVLPDGRVIRQPVLPGLTTESTSYTFSDHRGLLYSTQFAQAAILTFEAAAFAELRMKGYVSENAVYAGHSLGEYGALSALSQDMPMSSLAELAFYRGLMIEASLSGKNQLSVTFGMVAVNPRRVGGFGLIAAVSQELLEIVNFNVDGEQYVCSGTTTNVYVLGKLLDHIADSPEGPGLVSETVDATGDASIKLHKVIGDLFSSAKSIPRPLELRRGRATIPLQGIDVPFHSTHLRSTVDRFRQCLLKPEFLSGNVNMEELVGRYIPNLVGRPFSVDQEYIREVFGLTHSPVLAEMLGV